MARDEVHQFEHGFLFRASPCSPLPTPPGVASAVLKACLTGRAIPVFFLENCMPLSQPCHIPGIYIYILIVPCGITTSLDLAIHKYIYRMHFSGARRNCFSCVAVNVFDRCIRYYRARRPGWHLAGPCMPCVVIMRVVDAATLTNNAVIEIMLFLMAKIGPI